LGGVDPALYDKKCAPPRKGRGTFPYPIHWETSYHFSRFWVVKMEVTKMTVSVMMLVLVICVGGVEGWACGGCKCSKMCKNLLAILKSTF